MATETSTPSAAELLTLIRDIRDFPKPGILFRDITPLLRDPACLSLAVEFLTQPYRGKHIDIVVGAESRGFIFATAVARNLSAGFVPIRKPGKLPAAKRAATYDLEYGTDTLEIHSDAIEAGQRVLMVDDLLATGGTAMAALDLISRFSIRQVHASFIIELDFLKGRQKLSPPFDVTSVVHF